MSRTYRKTSTKQGSPRNWGRRSMAKMDHTKAKKPKPYTVKTGLYQRVTEQRETDYACYCPVELRTYVSPGTPQAHEELGPVITWGGAPLYICRREPSKWYLVPPNVMTSRTYDKYLGPNPEFDWDYSSEVNRQERLFDHVHRNRTGGRSRAMERYKKRRKSRIRRLEGKEFIRTYEHEDHIIYEHELSYIDDYDEYEDYQNYLYELDREDYDEPEFYYEEPYDYDYLDWDY